MADPVKPLEWMRAVRDSSEFTTARLAVLLSLALRMRSDGAGYASQLQLADDAGVSESTARKALRQARDRGYLEQTRRGHRVTDGTALASEYLLKTPPQPVTPDRLGQSQPVTPDRLEQSQPVISDRLGRSQPVTSATQPVTSATQPVTSDRPRGLHPEVFTPENVDDGAVIADRLAHELGIPLDVAAVAGHASDRLADGWHPDDLVDHVTAAYQRTNVTNPSGFILTVLRGATSPPPPKTPDTRRADAAAAWGRNMFGLLDREAFIEALDRQHPDGDPGRLPAAQGYEDAHRAAHRGMSAHLPCLLPPGWKTASGGGS